MANTFSPVMSTQDITTLEHNKTELFKKLCLQGNFKDV
jgi:hypothetical protein